VDVAPARENDLAVQPKRAATTNAALAARPAMKAR
jgi:hypothetical protein